MTPEAPRNDVMEEALACYAAVTKTASERGWREPLTVAAHAHVEGYLLALEAELDAIDAELGLAGEGRTRSHGDRAFRIRALRGELTSFRRAAAAARFVR